MENALTAFDFEDVAARPKNLAEETPFSSAFIETFDGLNIYLFFYLIESKPFAAVSFTAANNADAEVKAEAAELENAMPDGCTKCRKKQFPLCCRFVGSPGKNDREERTGEKTPAAGKKKIRKNNERQTIQTVAASAGSKAVVRPFVSTTY